MFVCCDKISLLSLTQRAVILRAGAAPGLVPAPDDSAAETVLLLSSLCWDCAEFVVPLLMPGYESLCGIVYSAYYAL